MTEPDFPEPTKPRRPVVDRERIASQEKTARLDRNERRERSPPYGPASGQMRMGMITASVCSSSAGTS